MGVSPVSIIIPALNEEKYLPLLLKSLAAIREPMQVIIVDGGSSDATVANAEEARPLFTAGSSLKVLQAQRGVARQRNLGAMHAVYPILMFLDADVVFTSQRQYEKLVTTFERKKYVLAAPLLCASDGDWRANLIYFQGLLFQLWMQLFRSAYFGGGCLLVRKDTFINLGGFDESLRVSEDIDFSTRAGTRGLHGIIWVYIGVSSRRFRALGYAKVYAQWVYAVVSVMFGRVHAAQKIDYHESVPR